MASSAGKRQLQRGVSPSIDPPTFISFDERGRAPSVSPTAAWEEVCYSIETSVLSAGPSSEYSSYSTFSRSSSVDSIQQEQNGLRTDGAVPAFRQQKGKAQVRHERKRDAVAMRTGVIDEEDEEVPWLGGENARYAPQQAGIAPSYENMNYRPFLNGSGAPFENKVRTPESLEAYARRRREEENAGTTIYTVSEERKRQMERAFTGKAYETTVSDFEKALDELNLSTDTSDVSDTFSRRTGSTASSATTGSLSELGEQRGLGMFVVAPKARLETVVEVKAPMFDRGTSP